MVDGDRGAPHVISHYRLDEEIGRGGMGAVYRATDLRDNSVVAVKLLRSELSEDPSYRVRFQREAHVAALLRSPYTVHLIDYGLEGGRYFLAMDFVEGRSLREELRDGPLDVLRALQVAETVARALEEAEARGVVHRDIKPDNIMLGEDDVARVLDFGVARQAGTRTLTVAGGFVGSFPYASPEQAAGEADHRSDIYSLGVTLYQALTGSPPFSGTPLELIEQHRSTPMPEGPVAGVPEVAVAILRRCLAKDPKQRYQTASSLAGALSEAMREIEEAAAAETADAAPVPAETVAAEGPEPAITAERAEPGPADEAPAPSRSGLLLRLENGRPSRRFGLRTGGQRYDLHIRNRGETKLRTTLTASDATGACRFTLPAEVDTQPGTDTVIPVEVRPRRFRWRGGQVRSEFVVGAEGGGGPPVETRSGFDDNPPRWPMAGGGFLMVAAIVAAVVGAVLLGGGEDEGEGLRLAEPASEAAASAGADDDRGTSGEDRSGQATEQPPPVVEKEEEPPTDRQSVSAVDPEDDLDGDGVADVDDQDVDGDGVGNAVDAFPRDPAESLDTDGDGIGNNADVDDDGDGVPDVRDEAPLDPGIPRSSGADAEPPETETPQAEEPSVPPPSTPPAPTPPPVLTLALREVRRVNVDSRMLLGLASTRRRGTRFSSVPPRIRTSFGRKPQPHHR